MIVSTIARLCGRRSTFASSCGQRFADTQILLAIGNNDEECGNYSIHPNGMFLIDTADVARNLAHADESFVASWQRLGSYNIPLPNVSGVRILVLNTVFFSKKYHAASFQDGCASVPSTGGGYLLEWLESELSQAKCFQRKGVAGLPYSAGNRRLLDRTAVLVAVAWNRSAHRATLLKAIVPMWIPS